MTIHKKLLLTLSFLHIFANAEVIQIPAWGSPAREIKIPAKFICTPKIGAALVKSATPSDWQAKEVTPSSNDSFVLIIDRYENFEGEDKESCTTSEMSNNDVNDTFYKISKAKGQKLCALRHFHLASKSVKLSSSCQVTATNSDSGVYCNDLAVSITERYYVDIPGSMFILPLGRVVMSQGACLPIP